jgi:phosphoglycolate phosphatase
VSEHDAVVYDLDGTLVRLAVDWSAVREDAAAVYRTAGVDPADRSLWALLADADGAGVATEVEATIAAHERRGARESDRLPGADRLAEDGRPAAVCSLNCEAACRVALDRHGVADRVAAVVGRDSVPARKPDPAPLLATVDALGVDPGSVLFVGDSERDAETARRAGTDFEFVDYSG